MDTVDLSRFAALKPLTAQWNEKLKLSRKHKHDKFGKDAVQAVDYYLGPHNFLYSSSQNKETIGFSYGGNEEGSVKAPVFQMTYNKISELVQLFGPILYNRNPTRVVNPRRDWKPPDLLMQMQQQQPQQPQDPNSLSQGIASFNGGPGVQQQIQMDEARIQAVAELLEAYLNYTPNELNLKEDMRLAIDEALVKGRSCMWTQLYTPSGSNYQMVGSFFKTVDDLFVDPDATQPRDWKWIAEQCTEPTWEVERTYGLPTGTLKDRAVIESTDAKAYVNASKEGEQEKRHGKTSDLIVYNKVWSKMGMGARFKQASGQLGDQMSQSLEVFGDYVYLVIAPNVPFPMNVPPDLAEKYFGDQGEVNLQQAVQAEQVMQQFQQAQGQYQQQFGSMPQMPQGMAPGTPPPPQPPAPQLQQLAQELGTLRSALQWPIPFWCDDEWPVTNIEFHPLFNQAWPMSHIKPALGEQNFLDWAYSFMAGHIRNTCRTFVAIDKGATEEAKNTIQHGGDMTVIEFEKTLQKTIGEMIQFLTPPTMNPDVFKVIQATETNFEKRTGLSEMMYAQTSTQSRSAADVQAKASSLQIRPDDMSNRVEDAATLIARKEAIAARLCLKGSDIAPIMGPIAADYWDRYVVTNDLNQVGREFDYRIEASSARKPNKDKQVQDTSDDMQVLMPALQQHAAQTGDYTAMNALLQAWAKARDMGNIDEFLLKPPPAPPPGRPPPQQAQGSQPAPRNGQPQPARR